MIKILAVDDEPGICEILKKTFKDMGFTVLTANSGKESLAIVSKERPSIVFLDVKMLGMSGLEVLKEIKAIDKGIKVIMVTVNDEAGTKDEAKRLGADYFVTKPFSTDELEKLVSDELESLRNPNILIVDDEEDILDGLSNFLSHKFSCRVETSLNGGDALLKLKEASFDLVITDIKMPGLSGIDIMKQAQKFSPQTKFLAISAYDSDEVAHEAIQAGAVDFILKPHSPEAIELKVRQVLINIGKYKPK